MEVFLVTAENIQPPNPALRLEYPFHFARAGTYDLDNSTSPTLDVIPTRSLALAVSTDNQPSQVVNVITPVTFKSKGFLGCGFGENTLNQARVLRFK